MEDDLRAFGVPEGTIAAAIEEHQIAEVSKSVDFLVWPENCRAIEVFIALENKWRVDGFSGQMHSPCYDDVECVMRHMKVADPDAMFADLLLMEGAALRIFDERLAAARNKPRGRRR